MMLFGLKYFTRLLLSGWTGMCWDMHFHRFVEHNFFKALKLVCTIHIGRSVKFLDGNSYKLCTIVIVVG